LPGDGDLFWGNAGVGVNSVGSGGACSGVVWVSASTRATLVIFPTEPLPAPVPVPASALEASAKKLKTNALVWGEVVGGFSVGGVSWMHPTGFVHCQIRTTNSVFAAV